MTDTAPNALIERLKQMELYEFDVPATKNIGSEGYYRTEIGELAAEALRTQEQRIKVLHDQTDNPKDGLITQVNRLTTKLTEAEAMLAVKPSAMEYEAQTQRITELEAERDEAREACEKWKSALELQIEKWSPSTTESTCPHCGHVTCGCYPDTEGR